MPTPEPKRCLGCGYILENLPEPRCPECGRSFDPGDPTTFRGAPAQATRGTTAVWFVVGSWLIVVGHTAAIVIAGQAGITAAHPLVMASVPTAIIAAWLCNAGIALRSGLEIHRCKKAGRACGDWPLAFVLAGAGVIGLSGCVGLVGWLVWGVGDPFDIAF